EDTGAACTNWTDMIPGRSPGGSVMTRVSVVEPASIVPKIGSVLPGVVNKTVLSAFKPWPWSVIFSGPGPDDWTACGSTESITARLNGTAWMHGLSTGSAPAGGGSSVSI